MTASSPLDWLADQRPAMLGLLADLVNIDSGSRDKAGVDRVGERLAAFLTAEGIPVARHRNETLGDALSARTGGEGRPVLLLGHQDTVFPAGEAARRPFALRDGRVHGPGVADMKAGLVMNAFVLAACHRAGEAAPLRALFTSDEEIGSPGCRPLIEAAAREARAVLNAEPGRPSGNVVTGRKGGIQGWLTVHGRAAHAGANFTDGASAIAELAHVITALHALTDLDRGVTVNVGLVEGGVSVNTVAPLARAAIDLRWVTPESRDRLLAEVEAAAARRTLPGTRAGFEIAAEFRPLVADEGSRALFAAYAGAMRDLGHAVAGEFAGGCADSGFTAAVGCPTLCATGPIGGRTHTVDEWADPESLVPRARGAALTALRWAEG